MVPAGPAGAVPGRAATAPHGWTGLARAGRSAGGFGGGPPRRAAGAACGCARHCRPGPGLSRPAPARTEPGPPGPGQPPPPGRCRAGSGRGAAVRTARTSGPGPAVTGPRGGTGTSGTARAGVGRSGSRRTGRPVTCGATAADGAPAVTDADQAGNDGHGDRGKAAGGRCRQGDVRGTACAADGRPSGSPRACGGTRARAEAYGRPGTRRARQSARSRWPTPGYVSTSPSLPNSMSLVKSPEAYRTRAPRSVSPTWV